MSNYRLHPERNDIQSIEVLKPHGSINWVANVTLGGAMYVQRPVLTISQGDPDEYTAINVVDSPQHKGHPEILVAHYAPEKEPQINSGLLKDIRDLSCDRVKQATSITIIGVHIPSKSGDDPFLDDFFALQSVVRRPRSQSTLSIILTLN